MAQLKRQPSKIEEFGQTFRKKQFRTAFDDLPEDEEIFQHYTCSLTGDGLAGQKGRLYLTTHYLAFTSSLFGKTTRQVLQWKEVEGIRRDDPDISVKTNQSQLFIYSAFADLEGAWETMKDAWHQSLSNDDGSVNGTPESPLIHNGEVQHNGNRGIPQPSTDPKNKIDRANISLSDDSDEDEVTYQELMEQVAATKVHLQAEDQHQHDKPKNKKKQKQNSGTPPKDHKRKGSGSKQAADNSHRKQQLIEAKAKLQRELSAHQASTGTTTTQSTTPPSTTTFTSETPAFTPTNDDDRERLQKSIADEKQRRQDERDAQKQNADLRRTPIAPLPHPPETSDSSSTLLLLGIGLSIAVIGVVILYRTRG